MSTTTAIHPKEKFIRLIADSDRYSAFTAELRKTAVQNIAGYELPTTRDEEWKYTRTTRLASETWKWSDVNAVESIEDFRIPGLNAVEITFINGRFSPQFSSRELPEGLSMLTDTSVKAEHLKAPEPADFFEAFQAATVSSAMYLHVEKNAIIQQPVHILHLITDERALSTPTIVLHLEKGAVLDLTESFCGTTKGFTIRRLNAHISSNARLEYHKIQNETDDQFLINIEEIHVEGDGYTNKNTLTVDGGWVRNDLRITLEGQNIESHLSGFYLPRRKQHIDNHTRVDHKFPHCTSNELYKGILFDNSTGVFNGKVYVWKDAQKTNAYQNNANILAGDQAVMNTKPELEIYADDVKCSHGTTTGQLDDQAMFYLRARGMSPDSARRLLTNAFINDVLDKVSNENIRHFVTGLLAQKGLLTI